MTDISVFPADNGRLYLSAIVDCFDGMVVGYATSRHPTTELAEDSFNKALHSQDVERDGGLIIHSERGAHYRGRSWMRMTQAWSITCSMSKKGYSPDNSACEGFFGRMKVEMFTGTSGKS